MGIAPINHIRVLEGYARMMERSTPTNRGPLRTLLYSFFFCDDDVTVLLVFVSVLPAKNNPWQEYLALTQNMAQARRNFNQIMFWLSMARRYALSAIWRYWRNSFTTVMPNMWSLRRAMHTDILMRNSQYWWKQVRGDPMGSSKISLYLYGITLGVVTNHHAHSWRLTPTWLGLLARSILLLQ